MNLRLFILSVFFLSFTSWGQDILKEINYTHFQLEENNDTIEFLMADTDLKTKKPLFLFCQGSLPVPLLINFDKEHYGEDFTWPSSLSNFDLDYLNKYYHVVVISMPKTPLMVESKFLNQSLEFITDTTDKHSYDLAYLRADYMKNYVDRANKVIEYLSGKKWIDSKKVVVAGHSQGSRIAVGIAASNKKVTHLGLFGYNPNGRIDQFVRQARKDAEAGKITWEEADSIQQKYYNFYKRFQNKDTVQSHPHLVSWKSFSEPTISQLVALKQPVYIAYGSADIIADLCDLLPFYFIRNQKENYVIKRYPNVEHNFFPLNKDDSVDYKNGKWIEVMNSFVDWSLEE